MARHKLSERVLAKEVGVSRGTVRNLLSASNVTLETVERIAAHFNLEVSVTVSPHETSSSYSVLATSFLIDRDGFDSWKIHIFNFVDEFRRTLDPLLILLPPHATFNLKLFALMSSIVKDLTHQNGLPTPSWAKKKRVLSEPWFVSDMNSLKASAIIESPLEYRANNIFVHENFLDRA